MCRDVDDRSWLVARRGRALRFVMIVLGASVLAACQGGPTAAEVAKLHQQAQADLARWADAVAAAGGQPSIVLVGERTAQIGDWEAAVGDNNKSALLAGAVIAGGDLPRGTPPDAAIQWPDGSTTTVAVMSAEQAIVAIQSAGDGACGGCTPLHLMNARLSTAPIQTTRGPATGPAWEFAVEGSAVRVTQVALAHPVTVVPPPWNPNDPPVGLAIDSASGTVGGRDLTVTFIGAPNSADKPCGEDYSAEAVESDLAVVIIVTRRRNPGSGACSDVGARRGASVRLADPLGDRAVLEVVQGLPVPVTLIP